MNILIKAINQSESFTLVIL